MRKKSGKKVEKLSFFKIIKTLAIIGVLSTIAVALYIFWWASTLEIPSIAEFDTRQVEQSTKIYDRTGEVLLFDIHGDIRRTVIPIEDISRHLRNATIAIEDAEFYQHAGIRPTRTLKAIFDNITTGNLLGGQGGSTLTQQVVKNVYLTREKTVTRKVKEWVLAIAIEKELTKDEILSVYLNEMPYGGTIYGAQEAAKYFFAKSAGEITLAESAYLAALPQRPSYYSPHGPNMDKLDKRKNLVLAKMLKHGFITDEEYNTAFSEEVTFNKFKDHNILAPHFVFFIRNYLEEEYGIDAVYKGGLQVTTTINTDIQEVGERIIKKFAVSNEEEFNAENAALVAIDPRNGQILAMVGSRDYFDEDIDGKFNVATAYRQPGSTFKPIVYSTAFEKGYSPNTVVFDLQTQFSTTCAANNFTMSSKCYSPVNYDGKFNGPITLRNALAQSVNIPAVKVLHLVGIKAALTKAYDLGIKGLTEGANHYGLSLVLGGGEVSPLELTGAYSVFANDGIQNPVVGILKVEDSLGNTLEEFKSKPERVLSEQAARNISDVLSDNVARSPAYGRRSFLYFDNWDIAAKTGTTNDFRDVWVVGYTPTLAVGTWAGNNDNSPIVKKVAGFVIAPMWRAFMDEALPYVQNHKFIKPKPLPEDSSPMIAGDWQMAFLNAGGAHSILHFINKDNPQSLAPIIPGQDSQYSNWEYPIQMWANGVNIDLTANSTNTTLLQTNNTQGDGTLKIIHPSQGSNITPGIPITIIVNTPTEMSRVEYFLNGVYLGASTKAPYSLTVVPPQKSSLSTIKAIGHMVNSGGIIVDSITFSTQ